MRGPAATWIGRAANATVCCGESQAEMSDSVSIWHGLKVNLSFWRNEGNVPGSKELNKSKQVAYTGNWGAACITLLEFVARGLGIFINAQCRMHV